MPSLALGKNINDWSQVKRPTEPLSPKNALFEKFEEYEETVIGRGVHEELHAMIDEWAQYCSMK